MDNKNVGERSAAAAAAATRQQRQIFPTTWTVLLGFVCLLFSCNCNTVMAGRIRIPNASSDSVQQLTEITLDDGKYQFQTLPALTRVYLRCNLKNIVWYKNGVKFNRKKEILKLQKFRESDIGNYTCQSTTNPNQSSHIYLSLKAQHETSQGFPVKTINGHNDQHHDDDYADYVNDSNKLIDLNNDGGGGGVENNSPPKWHKKVTLFNLMSKPKGSLVKLSCTVDGNPIPNITWTKNDQKPERLNGKIIYKKLSLIMANTIESDSGNYKCIVCNAFGCIQHTTRLFIIDNWRTLDLLKETNSNILPALNDQHNQDGHEIHSNFAPSIQSLSQIASTKPNSFYQTNDDDDYIYSATDDIAGSNIDDEIDLIKNQGSHQLLNHDHDQNSHHGSGSFIDSTNMTNNEQLLGQAPTWRPKTELSNISRKPSGSYVKLTCMAFGNPIPNVTWTKDNQPIEREMGKIIYKRWSMFMEDAIPEDSGDYKCNVCNSHGCIEHTTNLVIQDRQRSRPLLREGYPKNVTALRNTTVTFECKVYSDLTPHIVWTFTDKDKNNESHVIETDSDGKDILKLDKVQYSDEGWYTCLAANSLGSSNSTAYLRIVEHEEAPISMPVKDISMTIFKFSVGGLLIFGTALVFVIARKIKHDKLDHPQTETIHQWTKKVIIYKPSGDPNCPETIVVPIIKIEKQRTTLLQSTNCDPTPFNEYEFPLDSNWELPRSQLTLGLTLGEGAFGRVVKAEAVGLAKNPGHSIVAVKMVKEGHTDADMASLVREMEVMKMIGKHININDLLGCCSQDGPLHVIVAYAPHGNLKDFLKKNHPAGKYDPCLYEDEERHHLTQKDLLSFAFQVARGMEYLASRRFIHRDLAARNVLVSYDFVIKIADFGLARDIQDTDYYRKNTNGRLPIKWMAPESLEEKFYDIQSDVWSYGVLLWEIMTFGDQPYPDIISAKELSNYLLSGQRMEKPPTCSLNIYMLMRQCWNYDAHVRPTFIEIVENLDKILTATANANEEYLDLVVPILETPPSSDDEQSDTDTLRETSLIRYHH